MTNMPRFNTAYSQRFRGINLSATTHDDLRKTLELMNKLGEKLFESCTIYTLERLNLSRVSRNNDGSLNIVWSCLQTFMFMQSEFDKALYDLTAADFSYHYIEGNENYFINSLPAEAKHHA